MSQSILLLLLFLCLAKGPTLGLSQRQRLVTLLTDDGQLLVLREARKGQEYQLQPKAIVESVRRCSFCPRKNSVVVSIRFWKKQYIALARSLLVAQGRCRKEDQCLIDTYQSKRLFFRDNFQQWQTLTPSIQLWGILPPTKRIVVVPMRGAAVNASLLTPERLAAFQVSLTTSTADREEKRRLKITGEDLRWAQQMLQLPDAQLIDGASLRKLSTWLLKAKTPDVSAEQLPALLASLERRLTVSPIVFKPGMEALLPKGHRAKAGQKFFARRRVTSKEWIEIPFGPSSSPDAFRSPKSLVLDLRVSEKFKSYAMPTKTSVENSADASDILKRVDQRMTQMMIAWNRTESQRKALEEKMENSESERKDLKAKMENSESKIKALEKKMENYESERKDLKARMENSESERKTFKTKMENSESERKALAEEIEVLKNQLNRTEYLRQNLETKVGEVELQRQAVEEQVTRMKNAPNFTTSGPNFVLLQRQVQKLAMLTNASHVLRAETMDLTAVSDCLEVQRRKLSAGVYFLRSLNRPLECTAQGDMVVLKRDQGDVDFNASWSQYEAGLGEAGKSDYFVGLQNLSFITQTNEICMTLLFKLWKIKTSVKRATYDGFRISPRHDGYRLSYEGYSGTLSFDVFSIMKGQKFSTFDVDHDNFVGNCAKIFRSGNWHNSCVKCNIFGPKTQDASSGMCCSGVHSSQGDMCSPLASVRMLLRSKAHTEGSRRIIFSAISTGYRGNSCTAKLKFFTVTATGIYTVTVGGAGGGFNYDKQGQPGGRGATVKAEFFFRKGTRLAAVAGCPGFSSLSGLRRGGDASWIISRSKKLLLAVAGGGGGSSKTGNCPILPGMHGRATPDGGDSWWDPQNDSPSAESILLLGKVGTRAKGWAELRHRLLTATSGDFQSGGDGCKYGGGGGGGYEGGIECAADDDAGGGGGSLCSAAEATSCRITAGGNMRRSGFVLIQRKLCF